MTRHPPLDAAAVAGLAGTICLFPFAGYEWIIGKTPGFTLRYGLFSEGNHGLINKSIIQGIVDLNAPCR